MYSQTDCAPHTDSAFISWVNFVSYLTSNESQFSHQKKRDKIFTHDSGFQTQINWKKAYELLSPVQAEELYLIVVIVDLKTTATTILSFKIMWQGLPC